MSYNETSFHQLLKMAVKNNVSDIHLRTNERPFLRMNGSLKQMKGEPLSQKDLLAIAHILIKDKKILEQLGKIKEYDGSYQYSNICRVRFNLLKFQDKYALVLRVISMTIPTIADLGLPNAIKRIAEAKRGLVLVTGVTGSGKSSTLAALLEEINLTRQEHILTIEDPVEFLFTSKKCRITQREIGPDTDNFKIALRAALRQDPDVIVIGELRDPETIQIAMKAAETGHLVFGTVHTTNALTTINRLVSMFTPEEQNNVKMRLADCLYGTISQRLLPSLNGKGRVCAQEIMVNKVGTQDCIRGKEPLSGIYVTICKGNKSGESQSFDQHLTELYLAEKISHEVALDAASSPTNFERNLQFGDSGSEEDDDQDEDNDEVDNQDFSLSSTKIQKEKNKSELELDFSLTKTKVS